MIVPLNTTVAVVDGEHFRLYRNVGEVGEIRLHELPEHDSEDRPSSSGRSSSSANPADKQMEEDAFGKGVTEKLNRMVLEGRIETLIIIAAPRSLGEMRRSYHAKLHEILLAEIDKTLTSASTEDIEKTLMAA